MALPMSIGLLLFSGFQFRDVARIVEMYGPSSRLDNVAWEVAPNIQRNVHFLSLSGGRVVSSSGVHVWTERIDLDCPSGGSHILLVAGGGLWEETRLCSWLRHRSLQSGVAASIGSASCFFPPAAT